MGQTACCDSNMNKKNILEQKEQNDITNGVKNELLSSTPNQNNNQLNQIQSPTNLTGSVNAHLDTINEAEQLKNANNSDLRVSQNGVNNLGASVNSFKLNESLNKNPSTISHTNINNKLSIRNSTMPFSCIQTFEAHNDKIVSLIELSSGEIATGSYDRTIKIWDINTQLCKKSIEETGNVLCLLEFRPGFILSGTDENKIQLWDINNSYNKPLNSFEGHLLWVNCLAKCNDNIFASGSNDSDIRIWDYNEKVCINVLKGHSNCVLTMIALKNGNLCSGSADLTIKIWDWENGSCLNTLNGHKKWIKCVYQLENGYIISGSDDRTIRVWNDYKTINELTGHQKSVRAFCQISNSLFASASFDRTIKIWNINNMNLFQTLEGHQANVICVLLHSSGCLISCSTDHTIKIWK